MSDNPASQLMSDVLVAVTALPGTMFWRQNVGVAVTARGAVVKFGVKGTPDILGVVRSRATAIECKFGTGALRRKQKLWRNAWLKAGGKYVLARSVDQVLAELAS